MLLREKWSKRPSRDIIAVGMACLWIGVLLAAAGSKWLESPPLLSGFLLGLAGVLLGVSIVINIAGLRRYRTEQARR